MLEKPDITDEQIETCLQHRYGLAVASLDFLPLGADANTAAYKVVDRQRTTYFLKLRGGEFDIMSVVLPAHLAAMGVDQIMAPLPALKGQLWTELTGFRLVLYPFVTGVDGYQRPLTDRQCVEFGRVIKAVHTTRLPLDIRRRLRQESFSPQWRESVYSYMRLVETEQFIEPVAARLADFLLARRRQVDDLLEAADYLGRALSQRGLPNVLCHGDVHAGNVLLMNDGRWYLVDWDDPVLAPKERDLMHIGGGVGVSSVWTEAAAGSLFYEGYGQAEIDRPAVAYYRCERAIQDIAAVCRAVIEATVGPEDRERGLGFLMISFEPGDVVDIALRTVAAAGNLSD